MAYSQKKYEHTPKGKYRRQRANAEWRGIQWLFTFESWWKVWQDSGKWEERGTVNSGYVMSRLRDQGPYSPENVEIKTMAENSREARELPKAKKFWDTWQPYPRTNAWEYIYNGIPINRWTEEEQRQQAMRITHQHWR